MPLAGRAALGGGGGIPTITKGNITVVNPDLIGTDTISIDSANSMLLYAGVSSTSAVAGTSGSVFWGSEITSDTVITTTSRGFNSGTAILEYGILTFPSGIIKSVQYGTITIGAALTATATISAVVAAKTVVYPTGMPLFLSTTQQGQLHMRFTVTGTTTITGTKGIASGSAKSGFIAVEYF